ncbi:MAG: MMPL family transporter [Phycisphaerae bacterium]|jgi:RND superfamily putative drug exporter
MFHALGRTIADHPWRIVAPWALVALGGTIWAFTTPKPPPDEMGSFLPRSAPFTIASEKLARAFPDQASRSTVVIIVHRPARVTDDDLKWLDAIPQLARRTGAGRVVTGYLSPVLPYYRPRLVSRDEQAAMAVVNLSTNMISGASGALVNELEALIRRHPPPPGLTVELSGQAGIGRDYAAATAAALHRTTWVTIIAVLVILVLVYRSPVGAVVPLLSIGLSVYLTLIVLAALAKWARWDVSNIERIFAVVLIFGAGVDYCLFWIARYREHLHAAGPSAGAAYSSAAMDAARHAGPAILFSALTTIVGMCSLMAAQLGPSRGAGKVLVLALAMALLAGLTLVPAIARLLGGALFWPVGTAAGPAFTQRVVWPRLADGVVRAPTGVLALGLVLLAVPAGLALNMQPQFDSLLQLPEGSTSQRGYRIAEAHFAPGQIYSSTLLFTFDRMPAGFSRMSETSANLRRELLKIRGVADVYSLDSPIGRHLQVRKPGLFADLRGAVSQGIEWSARDAYLATGNPALRFEILIAEPPFSLEAMAVIDQVRAVGLARAERFADAGVRAEVHLTGLTPYIMAVRDVAGRDQRVVMTVATLLIALIVLMLVRDLPLTLFMVFSTLLTYGATLKLTELFFVQVMGTSGIDWKVRLIVFVIVVAVGQDYNIFLVSRLMEERGRNDVREAVRRAIVSTGSIISSCGVIMAATLGSLWAGRLTLLREVGFALALGILIDTYFVRPLLIPSFYLALHGRRPRKATRAATSPRPADEAPPLRETLSR